MRLPHGARTKKKVMLCVSCFERVCVSGMVWGEGEKLTPVALRNADLTR